MGMVHEMKQGDTKPALRVQLLNGDGTSPDLTGQPVTFRMAAVPGDQNPVVDDGAATVINGPAGVVEYPWVAGDTANAGHFKGEFVVNGERTYPSGEGYIHIVIGSRLDIA